MIEINENCFFFRNKQGHYLYACSYFPSSDQSEIGIVIVPPVGHERLRFYRESVSLARDLAKAGYPTLRFDYRGEGESFGDFEDFDVLTRLEDIESAVRELKKRIILKRICLFGVRLGALFSLIIAEKLKIHKIILCEPVLDTKRYTKDLIRAYIILQRQYFANNNIKIEDIYNDLQVGRPISIYGFHSSFDYFDQLKKIESSHYVKSFKGSILLILFFKKPVIDIKRLPRTYQSILRHKTCHVIDVVTNFTWATKQFWIDKITELNNKTILWLNDNANK